jgi:acetolactate synthase-1/2/3 large subunit
VLVTSGPRRDQRRDRPDRRADGLHPVVCLTGQVPTHLIGNDAFQECDTTGITRPCTKHNYLVKHVDRLSKTLHEAFYVATSAAARGRW